MKLLEVHLYGFGKHVDRTFSFSTQTVVVGNNETGKSSLYEAILQIFFGFPTRASANRLEPKFGVRYGGWVKIELQDKLYQIERVEGKSSGVVTVTENGIYYGGEEELRSLLKGLTREQTESVYAFHLFDLQQIHQLSQEDLTELFFASGTTGTNPYAVLNKDAAKELQALYKPGGKKPHINRQLEELRDLENQLVKGLEQERYYAELTQQQQQVENRLGEVRNEIRLTKQQIFEAEEQQMLHPLFEEYEMLLHVTNERVDVSQTDQDDVRELSNRILDLTQKETTLLSTSVDANQLHEKEREIEELELILADETSWREVHSKIAELEEQLEGIVREQQPALAALAIDPFDLETKLEGYDLSYQKEQQLDTLLKPTSNWDNTKYKFLLLTAGAFVVLGFVTDWLFFYLLSLVLIVAGIVVPSRFSDVESDKADNFLKEYGVKPTGNYRARDIFDQLRKLQQLQVSYRQIEERLTSTLLERAKIAAKFPQHAQSESVFQEARRRLTKLHEDYRLLKVREAEHMYTVEQRKKAQKAKQLVEAQLQTIYEKYSVPSRDAFDTLVKDAKETAKKMERLQELKRRLHGKARKDFDKAKLIVELDRLESEQTELTRSVVTIEQQIDQLVSDEQRAKLLQQIEAKKGQLEELVIDYLAWQGIASSIETHYEHYQKDVFPATIQRASELFARFTASAYKSLGYSENRFVAVSKDGTLFEMKELSQATKEQAYLALRFALAEELSKEKPFVILMDDPFVHFDAIRFQQVVQWLMSEENQLPYLYFTCRDEWLSPHKVLHMETERSKS